MLSYGALNKNEKELEKQEWRDREEFESKNERLEKELKAAEETVASLGGAVRWYKTSQGLKHGPRKRESRNGSAGSPKSHGSPELRSPTH